MSVWIGLSMYFEHFGTAESPILSLVHLQIKLKEMDMLSAVCVCMMGDALAERFMRVIMKG